MASYKVAQDVEADDKLLGPFSFRQFIYLIIVAMAGFMAWGLFNLFAPLAIIPVPIILFFGALALPLRKDQPMETYLAAMVSFYLKPRKRMWQPDGIESLVEITAPKVVEVQRTKNLSESEAERRLAYLAAIADTRGWSIRHASMPSDDSPMQADVYNEAQATEDPLDDNAAVARSFESMIDKADARRRQEMLERLQHPETITPAPQPVATPAAQSVIPVQQPATVVQPPAAMQAPALPVAPLPATPTAVPPPVTDPQLTYNPYPTMHQSIVQPLSTDDHATPVPPNDTSMPDLPPQPDNTAKSTSEEPISPDIINLANNSSLSIETIAHEAERIKRKHQHDDGEVVISLR